MDTTEALAPLASKHADIDVLKRILGKVSVDEFMHDYFNKKALHIKGSEDKFDFLFRTDEFKENLDKADHIRAVFPLLRQANISIADIPDMLKAGASICVTGMEQAHPVLRQAALNIKQRVSYSGKVSFRSYLSPAGSGFDMHFDARVATAIQIGGYKRWWYKLDHTTRYPKSNSPHTAHLEEQGFKPPQKEDMESIVLGPGDMLCLPAGAWHCAKAEEDSLSLNLAFDYKNAGYIDGLLVYLKEQMNANPNNRAPAFSLLDIPAIDQSVVNETHESIDAMIELLKKLKTQPTELENHLKKWLEVC
ncbi:JmjC domain-containing protein [Agaribacterium sp. ZY112]|uniref:JmjC domain-containing protein n=1 Tax=Agaribacterium sp. ZY112 TaxID=3233574 RepID=UPI003525ABC7